MLYAILICSDPECADEVEVHGEPVDLEQLACDCGCTLQVISIDEAVPVELRVVAHLPRRGDLRRAA
jgi:hypothetical protein